MLRKITLLLACLAFLLTACQEATQSMPDPTAGETLLVPSPFATRTNAPASSSTEEAVSTQEEASSTPVVAGEPACTVISPQPTLGPTEQSLFPPVRESDWVSGPDTAGVTIIEYSDFQ
jgi:hypothetical protein